MGKATSIVAVVSLGTAVSTGAPVLGQVANLTATHLDVDYALAARPGDFGTVRPQHPLSLRDHLKTDLKSGATATVRFRHNSNVQSARGHVIVYEGYFIHRTGLPWPLRLASAAPAEPLWLVQQAAGAVPEAAQLADIEVVEGAIFGKYGSPGIIMGPHSVAVVQRGEFEYEVDRGHHETHVRCYSGAILVGSEGAGVRRGLADAGTATTLVDDALAGIPGSWVGGRLLLLSGPGAGQARSVTRFDAATGTVTVDPPFEPPVAAGVEYALTAPEGFLVLTTRTQTTVHEDGKIDAPQETFPRAFPGGQDDAWVDLVPEAGALDVYPGSALHRKNLVDLWPLDDDCIVRGPDACDLNPVGNLEVIIRARGPRRASVAGLGSASGTFQSAAIPRSPSGAALSLAALTGVSAANRAESGQTDATSAVAGPEVRAAPVRGLSGVIWQVAPYVIGSNEGETLGGLARMQAVHGRLLASVGGLYERFRGDEHIDLSESSLLYRFGRGGDLRVGRQHLFIGPVNNSRLGTLIGASTVDGAIWSAPPSRRLNWRVGYLRDSAVLDGGGASGWLGRVGGPLGRGLWGVTLLTANRVTGGLGASADLSLPLIPLQLDGYVEFGRDPYDRDLVTGGIYFAGLRRRTGIQLFVEYQSRDGFDDRVSLRLNGEFAPHWLAVGYLFQELGGKTSGGVALRYQWQAP
jgi:hypothetical protein